MSKLFGDRIIIPYDDFGLNIMMKKVKKISEDKKKNGNIEIGWKTVIEDIYLTGKDKKKIKGFNKSVLTMLMSMRTKEEIIETKTHLITRYVPHPNKMQFAQSVPVNLIHAISGPEVNWLQNSKKQHYPIDYTEFIKGFDASFEEESIQVVLSIKPLSDN